MDAHKIQGLEWIKHWAGGWSLLSCSYFGHQYTLTIEKDLKTRLESAAFVSRRGYSVCFLAKEEVDDFGDKLAEQAVKNGGKAREWCDLLKKRTDEITKVMKKLEGKSLSENQFQEFLDAFYAYVSPHIAVKKVVDYLPPKLLGQNLPQFTEARLYSEKVYAESEKFVQDFAAIVAKKNGLKQAQVLCMLKEELAECLRNGRTPPEKTLDERLEKSALFFKNGEFEFIQGNSVEDLEKALHAFADKGKISGKTAFPGVARGRVRIVFEPEKEKNFEKGDILVTGMTRPTFTHLIHQAAAIVTDAGGVLSHAAIVARELKKPCVVGTINATKELKNGDLIEVDATKGVIKILTREK